MLKTIKWNNHPILGNLTLDFSKPDGTCYNTIILAGENGVGKTTILETLSSFLNLGSIEPFEHIEYVIDNVAYSISPLSTDNAKFGFHLRKNLSNGTTERITSNKNNNFSSIEQDIADLRHYGCAYSKARSGFQTNKITTTSIEQLDTQKYETDTKHDFTSIKQLLVDIVTQDNSDWADLCESGNPLDYATFQLSSRKSRFTNAYNNFFDTLKFAKVDNTDPIEKKILFKKHGKNIPIDDLSTGEKQIVFRGTHLLKNSNSINGGIVLIDEPELSMHPRWQNKILQYYRNLFTKNNTQTSQIIIATHSEYVLRSALDDKNNVLIITLNDNNGTIEPHRITAPSVLPIITSAEINYLAFGIISVDYHIQLYGYLQSKENKPKIRDCDTFIASHALYDSTKYDKPSAHGTTNYQTLSTYIRNAIDHPDSGNTYTPEELKFSIEFLIELCR